MELFRALGSLLEPPNRSTGRIADLLGMSEPPGREAHSQLFLFQVYPYASVYLSAEGAIGGEARDRVAGFWRALDESPPAEPDYLPTILGLYARLVELEIESGAKEAARGWRRARHGFLWEHILSWIFPFLEKVARVGPPFYAEWSRMLEATLAQEVAELGELDTLPLALREAPLLADPRTEGAEAFVTSMLSPVRSGVVLSRSDLARAAGELGLGLRVGERAFILRTMLAQDSDAVLTWLGGEAERWIDRHNVPASVTPRICEFWSERAARGSRLLSDLRRSAAVAS